MKKILLSMGLFLSLAFGASAESQAVIINGELVVDKTVTQLLFDGELVTIVFNDGSTEDTFETLDILLNDRTAVTDVRYYDFAATVEGGTLSIDGLQAGQAVEVFNVQGQRVATTVAGTAGTEIDVTGLQGGTYVLRCGDKVVKFIKK